MSERNLSVELRPRSLDDLIGNQDVVAAIQKVLAERVPIAWLLSGPPGTGKTTLAHIIGRMVQGPGFEGEPEIEHENASNTNGVDWARQVSSAAQYKPLQGRFRVLVVDEAHKLTEAAQNCLLIPTEKKDSATVWIFCTTDPSKLLPALMRRCVTLRLNGITDTERRALVRRVLAGSDKPSDPDSFFTALAAADITSPGLIVMACERFLAGMTPNEAVRLSEQDSPEFVDIAKAVVQGDWRRLKPLLVSLKPSDGKAIRGIVSGFLRSDMLRSEGPRTAKVRDAILSLAAAGALYEDGLAWSATVAVLHKVCEKLSEGR